LSLDDDEPSRPQLPCDSGGEGREGKEDGGLPLSTHGEKTCRERGWAEGVGKDISNKHLEDILPSTPK